MKRTSIDSGDLHQGSSATTADKRPKPNPAAAVQGATAVDDREHSTSITPHIKQEAQDDDVKTVATDNGADPKRAVAMAPGSCNGTILVRTVPQINGFSTSETISTTVVRTIVRPPPTSRSMTTLRSTVDTQTDADDESTSLVPTVSAVAAEAGPSIASSTMTPGTIPSTNNTVPTVSAVAAETGPSIASQTDADDVYPPSVVPTEPSAQHSATNPIDDRSTSDPDEIKPELDPSLRTTVKTEPVSDSSVSASSTAAAAVPVVPLRTSCNYGCKCYRRNLQHRTDMAHPGDPDYRRPDYPDAPPSAPDCPFGARCYRRECTHFRMFRHPPSREYDGDRH